MRRDFSGSIREATPQVDVRNLGHLRAVPWLISALIAILALATLIHALVTIVARNRTNLAVLAALGLTRGQRRAVGVFASAALVFVGIVVAIPFGLIVGNLIWRAVTRQNGLPHALGRGVVDARRRADRRARNRSRRRTRRGARNDYG